MPQGIRTEGDNTGGDNIRGDNTGGDNIRGDNTGQERNGSPAASVNMIIKLI